MVDAWLAASALALAWAATYVLCRRSRGRATRDAAERERARAVRHVGAYAREFRGASRPLSLALGRLADRIASGEEPPK